MRDTDFDGIIILYGKFFQHIPLMISKFVSQVQSIFCDISNLLGHNIAGY